MVAQAYEYEKEHLLSSEEAAKGNGPQNGEEDAPPAKKQKPSPKNASTTSKDGDIRVDVFSEPMRGFFSTTSSAMKTPLFRRLDAELRERREKLLQEKGWSVTEDEKQKPAIV